MAEAANTTITASISRETGDLIDRSISGSGCLAGLVEDGLPLNRTTMIRAGILLFFENSARIERDPSLLYRAVTTTSMENAIKAIDKEARS